MGFRTTVEHGTDRQFDIVAVNSAGDQIGRLEADCRTDQRVARFWISNCCVAARWRRHGVATRMVMDALKEAARRYPWATEAFVDAFPFDNTCSEKAVVAFWESNGFRDAEAPRGVPLRGRAMTCPL